MRKIMSVNRSSELPGQAMPSKNNISKLRAASLELALHVFPDPGSLFDPN